MKTSDVLNTAADLIEERGWVQGGRGWPGMPHHSRPLCMEGGIMAALGVNFLSDNFDIQTLWDCPAYQAVERHTGEPRDPSSIGDLGRLWRFNDHPERTASEVVEVLRATAVIEAAREDAALLAEMGRV